MRISHHVGFLVLMANASPGTAAIHPARKHILFGGGKILLNSLFVSSMFVFALSASSQLICLRIEDRSALAS
jgi:hypothetical protein